MSSALEVAALAFERGLRELGLSGEEPELGNAAQFGQWAALAMAAGALWHQHGVAPDDPQPPCAHCGPAGAVWHVRFGPLLDTRCAQTLMRAPTYASLTELTGRQALLAIDSHGGQTLIPLFQFGPDGQPSAWVQPVLRALASVDITGWKVATWLFTLNPELEGQSPLMWLRDGRDLQAVLSAAPAAPALRAATAAARNS